MGIEIPQQRIPSLDGLRAVSILLVLWSHLLGTEGFLPIQPFHRFGDLGVLGVRIFFVISGFLITTLLLNELRRTNTISLRQFYFRRTMRIFPAFYALIVLMGVAALAGFFTLPAKEFVYAVTYTMNFVAEPHWVLGHLWSLAVEEQFYLLWPATLALVGRRQAFRIAMAVVFITPVIRFCCLYVPVARPLIGLAFPTIADPLAIGCLLAGLRSRLDGEPLYIAFLESQWFWCLPPAILMLNALPGTKLNMLVTQSLLNVAIAIVIDRWVRFPASRGGAVLNWLPLRSLGVLSYSLYLWQQPFLNYTAHGVINRFPLNVILAFACAYASYRVVEKPCLDLRVWLERRWTRREAASEVSVATAGSVL